MDLSLSQAQRGYFRQTLRLFSLAHDVDFRTDCFCNRPDAHAWMHWHCCSTGAHRRLRGPVCAISASGTLFRVSRLSVVAGTSHQSVSCSRLDRTRLTFFVDNCLSLYSFLWQYYITTTAGCCTSMVSTQLFCWFLALLLRFFFTTLPVIRIYLLHLCLVEFIFCTQIIFVSWTFKTFLFDWSFLTIIKPFSSCAPLYLINFQAKR